MSIRLLHDFDDKLFMGSHDPTLVNEDEILENLNGETKLWYRRMMEMNAMAGMLHRYDPFSELKIWHVRFFLGLLILSSSFMQQLGVDVLS